jgi:hypothetical protein
MTKKGYFEGPVKSRTFILPLALSRAVDAFAREVSSRNVDDQQTKSEIVFDALCAWLKLDKATVLLQNSELLKKEAAPS